MNITKLNSTPNGQRTIEISCDELSFRALQRCLRRASGVAIKNAHHNPMTDDTFADFEFNGKKFELYTPFSDYLISNKEPCPDAVWDALVCFLADYKIRWWEKIF